MSVHTPAGLSRLFSTRRLYWLVWSGIALVFALQWLTYRHQIGAPAWVIVFFALVYTLVWAGLGFPIGILVRRRIRVRYQFFLILGAALIHLSAYYAFYRFFLLLTDIDYYRQSWFVFMRSNLFFALILGGLLLSALSLIDLSSRLMKRQKEAETLEKELVAAQLQNLKMQLQPHFLFNTLNSVMALMDEDVKAAQTMVARLAEFLRATLDLPADGLISLTRELHLAALYLQIEGVRFSDRLRVTLPVVVDPPDFRLPALILQPLLENAVKHGIAPHARGGEIRVGVETHADRVEVLVRNSGSGPVRIETGGSGLGLSLVRRRLDPCGGSLEVGFIEEGGYEARIRLPRRP